METSTPIVATFATPLPNRDLHRRTLLKNTVEYSPLRRRSIISSPVVLLERSDFNDESERSNRRNHVNMQKRLSNLPAAQPGTGSPMNDSVKFAGEQDMKDHLQICTRLYAENKITVKNAWKLQIIDVLRHFAQKTSPDTLQVAGTSLDIGAKVYGIRVDDIHADGLKLASSMARVADKRQEENANNSDEGGINEEEGVNAENAAKKKKKKKRFILGQKNTIVKDPQSLKGPLPKLESVFFSTRTNAEASAIDNLFTNTLKMDPCYYKFMLLSKEKAWFNGPDPSVRNIAESDRKKYSVTLNPLNNFKLCRPFNDFQVDEWDPEEEEKQIAVEKSMLSQRQEEVIYDENGIPIPELDGSIHDIFANHDADAVDDPMMDIEDDIHEEMLPQIRGEIAHIVDFQPEGSIHSRKSEYSYNTIVNTHTGKIIDQIWAGPSHWKLKFIRRSNTRFSGQVTSEKHVIKQSRRKVVPEMVNLEEDNYEKFDMTKILRIKKKPATMDLHKITLPIPDPTCLKLMDTVSELTSKPGTCPSRKKPDQEKCVDYEVSTYNYDNPNDSQYCPQQHNEDDDNGAMDDDCCSPMDEINEEVAMAAHQNFMGDNLVDAPELVPKSYVPYALQAKKMDMKKLKAAVWQRLTNSKEIGQKDVQVIPTTFSKLHQEVPSLLSEKMKKELTPPLTFVALLHLCNEQNLALKQHLGGNDFDIVGPAVLH